jgi:hypothetical protein
MGFWSNEARGLGSFFAFLAPLLVMAVFALGAAAIFSVVLFVGKNGCSNVFGGFTKRGNIQFTDNRRDSWVLTVGDCEPCTAENTRFSSPSFFDPSGTFYGPHVKAVLVYAPNTNYSWKTNMSGSWYFTDGRCFLNLVNVDWLVSAKFDPKTNQLDYLSVCRKILFSQNRDCVYAEGYSMN